MNKQTFKIILTAVVVGISLWYLYPTWEWYRMTPQERSEAEVLKDKRVGKIINLGLDLRGGTHLLLELDPTKLQPGMDVAEALDRAREIIRNRIDQFGVAEPLIAKQGERWIVVQLPGIKDPQRAKELIGKTALLEFRLVDNAADMSEIMEKLRAKNATVEDINKFPEIAKLLPADHQIFKGKEDRYYVLKSTPELTGGYLVNAKVELGQDNNYGYPHVGIEFNPEGAKLFARVTEENIDKNLAIVLDGVVQSAPVIRSAIPDGKAIIEGNFTMDDAKVLAMVLRAGALPAPVRIIEERTVGPTLGDDSIKYGILSTIIGAGIVVLFMLIYYGFSGLIADFALLLNLILLTGAMAMLHATLTLPGLAGIALTLGMAVDANVLILERIRDELKAGKTTRHALDAGYDKAFTAILDSNLTTLIAAVFLFQFGTGPVKGFAVTLTIGIIISMFTAITVTRMIYNILFQEKIIEHINI